MTAPDAPAPPAHTDHDVYLFNEGSHYRLYDHLGAHPALHYGEPAVRFAVWAPNAEAVSVVGDFNGWNPDANHLAPIQSSGVWSGLIQGLPQGANYKYHVRSRYNGYRVDKADPFGVHHETPPRTGSKVWPLDYDWRDQDWMAERAARQRADAPVSIYEVHLGSWMRKPGENRFHTYDELAELLPAYAVERGFTHVELLPVMEHPLYESWGYQTTGYFAPTSRFGTPQMFMNLVDRLHQAGVGVILDWVPSHFPSDEHGLGYFDGTHLFEHADPRLGFHPDWKSLIFNYGRNEIRSFLISSALFWLDTYHADGIRVDAVASMLYRNYSRRDGEWIPNPRGGNENDEAIDFLRRLNAEITRVHPDVQTFAEESTSWPGVTRSADEGGLGFCFKWDMGWMHDSLQHFSREPIHRKHHHNELTFRGMYMHTERFAMPLSHDEVVHGKGSLVCKMAGDDWQRRANLRLLLADQWTQPGKKLLFMGGEIAQTAEWTEARELDWWLLQYDAHKGIQALVDRLNRLYREEPALHELDHDPEGFRWLDADDAESGLLSYLRLARDGSAVVCLLHTTPTVRRDVLIGVPHAGCYSVLLNTDDHEFGGSGAGDPGPIPSRPIPRHGHPHMVRLTVPPLAALLLKHCRPGTPDGCACEIEGKAPGAVS